MPRDVKQKKQGDGMEGSMKNRISEEVLLKLDNRTTASLPLDCRHHGAQGHCSREKEPTKRLVEKPNPNQLLSEAKCLTTHMCLSCIHTTTRSGVKEKVSETILSDLACVNRAKHEHTTQLLMMKQAKTDIPVLRLDKKK